MSEKFGVTERTSEANKSVQNNLITEDIITNLKSRKAAGTYYIKATILPINHAITIFCTVYNQNRQAGNSSSQEFASSFHNQDLYLSVKADHSDSYMKLFIFDRDINASAGKSVTLNLPSA